MSDLIFLIISIPLFIVATGFILFILIKGKKLEEQYKKEEKDRETFKY